MSELAGRLSWQLAVYRLLNASTRPVGETEPILSVAEQREMREKWAMGWSPEAYAQLLNDRDVSLRLSVLSPDTDQ